MSRLAEERFVVTFVESGMAKDHSVYWFVMELLTGQVILFWLHTKSRISIFLLCSKLSYYTLDLRN